MTPVVRLRGLARSYGSGAGVVDALRPVDLTIDSGESVAIQGRSGSGKSTLLNLLGLLDRPTGGSYLLDGVDTASLSDPVRAKLRAGRVGFVFQSFHLLGYRTAVENVTLALMYAQVPRRERRPRAEAALAEVGLAHRKDFVPRMLSGGERQRVAIARAIATEPALLLADEPTGNLDSASAEEILRIFAALHASGRTMIIVTHDPGVAARARRQLHLADGVLTEAGA